MFDIADFTRTAAALIAENEARRIEWLTVLLDAA
jgi:hypothetical protein